MSLFVTLHATHSLPYSVLKGWDQRKLAWLMFLNDQQICWQIMSGGLLKVGFPWFVWTCYSQTNDLLIRDNFGHTPPSHRISLLQFLLQASMGFRGIIHQRYFSWSKTWLHRLGDDWIFQSTRALQSKLSMVWLESHPSCCHRLFQFSWTWHVNRSKNNLASGLRGSASSLVPVMKNKRMNCMLCIKLLPTFTYYFPLFVDTFLKNLITCMMDINALVEI